MNKFRIPRKLKKQLNKGMWLYPKDEIGYLGANPAEDKTDFEAYKRGELSEMFDNDEEDKRLDKIYDDFKMEVHISDSLLKEYIEKLCAKQFVNSSYTTLLEAKKHKNTITYYYEFINAYQYKESDFSNIACITIDMAEKHLKQITFRKSEKRRNKKRR